MKLAEIREILLAGQRSSMQGSYHRRAPDKKALPSLRRARLLLHDYVAQNPDDREGWRLLSQAQEALLNYSAARVALERAMHLSPSRDRRDLKKLALLKENEQEWKELSVSPELLAQLRAFLTRRLGVNPCDHSHRFTREWLTTDHPVEEPEKVIAGFEKYSGYCDCEVLFNVAT